MKIQILCTKITNSVGFTFWSVSEEKYSSCLSFTKKGITIGQWFSCKHCIILSQIIFIADLADNCLSVSSWEEFVHQLVEEMPKRSSITQTIQLHHHMTFHYFGQFIKHKNPRTQTRTRAGAIDIKKKLYQCHLNWQDTINLSSPKFVGVDNCKESYKTLDIYYTSWQMYKLLPDDP